MQKSEAEKIVKSSCRDWFSEAGSPEFPSFNDYASWAEYRWPDIFAFKSTRGPREDAELWFDEALNQNWRN